MPRRRWLIGGAALVALLAVGSTIEVVRDDHAHGAALTSTLAAPVNLEQTADAPDGFTLAWGPSQPYGFAVIQANKEHTWVKVGWAPSQDSRSPVVYEVSKNGAVVAPADATPVWTFTGLKRVTSFRVCVVAVNGAGQRSAPGCGTISRLGAGA